MFYAALDVSLRSVAVCIIDDEGKVRLERSVPSDVPDLVRCLNEFGEPIHQVGLEAGTLTQHLTYGLREAGFEVVCMEARQVNAALSAMRNKTDKHDARGIAQILRSGFGLTPRRFQSGEKDNPGRISHAGDSDVRATLYAAANAMLMRSIAWSSLKAWGMRLMKTKGRRRAIVAVARKLAVVLHRMWADGTEFRHGSEAAA